MANFIIFRDEERDIVALNVDNISSYEIIFDDKHEAIKMAIVIMTNGEELTYNPEVTAKEFLPAMNKYFDEVKKQDVLHLT